MNMDEYELEREASAPIDMLETYYSALGWDYERSGEDEIVSTFQGSWTQYELRSIWRAEDQVLQFLALPDIRVAAEKRDAVYETIGLDGWPTWKAVNKLPERIAIRQQATKPILGALIDAGMISPHRVPKGWQDLCGVPGRVDRSTL